MVERGAPPKIKPLHSRLLKSARGLTTPLLPDDYLALMNPLWSTRELRGTIERIQPETPEASTIVIRPVYEWPGHEPGQYLRIGVEIDGLRHWRAYSLTADPGHPDGLISITVKHVPAGGCRRTSPAGSNRGDRLPRRGGGRPSACPTRCPRSCSSSAPAAGSPRS